MENLKILLVCGSGASSGFMATNIRKAAKTKGIDCKAVARSTSEIDSYIDSVDAIMIGPHMKHIKEDLESTAKEKGVVLIVMEKSYYSMLDGEGALNHLLSVIKK